MKPDQPATLSEYLLYEASKFLLYPHRSRERRTKTTVEHREMFDKSLADGVEGRRTFGPYLGKIANDPISLDDIYCRQRLRAVPEMVRVTLKLKALWPEFNANSNPQGSCDKPEWSIYLQESADCLILGLSQAAVAIARAAVEACLREAYAKVPGNTAQALQDTTLNQLVFKLSTLFDHSKGRAGLSQEAERWARDVQGAGNDVLHGRSIDAEEALKVFEAARLVIRSVAGG